MAILITDKINFRTKKMNREKEEPHIMIKGSIHQDIAILNVYAQNSKAVHEVKTDRTKKGNRQTQNYGWRGQYSFDK